MKRLLSLLSLCGVLTAAPHSHADDVTPVIAVTSPAYSGDVAGDTPVRFDAPSMHSVTVKCWQSGSGFGADSTVATVNVDATGKGSFTFPAAKYPHGPLMIRLTGEVAGKADTCILQVYNKTGTPWHEGMPSTPPPAAAGMSLVYADDFGKMPTISVDGKGATYDAHKPGGGDFSGIPFVDPKQANNPFSQVDTYLRIRADQNKNSTGLIASVNGDFSGVTALAPCYFECRFVAQSFPGSWPAFWLLSRPDNDAYPSYCDEYDIIEGYGGVGPKQPNFPGYNATSHYWGQKVNGKQPPDDIKTVEMLKLGGRSTWYDTFHTYGMKVTETESIYYLDDIEVYRYATHSPAGKTDPFYFLINYAVGGASGWKLDMKRYNGVGDMYVDYVRVYSSKPMPSNAMYQGGGGAQLKTKGIGLNFSVQGDASTELAPADVAGGTRVSQANWNNLPAASGTLSNAKDQSGNPVKGFTATWSVPQGDQAWRSQAGRDWGFHDSQLKLQKGYVNLGGTLELHNVPYAKYSVYVYLGAGDNAGTGKVTISSNSGGVDPHGTYFYHLGWADGKFIPSDATTLESAKDGNVVIFSGNTSKDISLEWLGNLAGGWTGATGVQIVETP